MATIKKIKLYYHNKLIKEIVTVDNIKTVRIDVNDDIKHWMDELDRMLHNE